LAVHLSDFNAYVQAMIDPGSSLYGFAPDAAILAVQSRDLAPALWNDFSTLSPEQIQSSISSVISDLRSWITAFRRHSQAHLIVHNFEQPEFPARGLLDAQSAQAQSCAFQQLNRELQALAATFTGVYVLDYDALVARHGRRAWHDERKWLTVRLP